MAATKMHGRVPVDNVRFMRCKRSGSTKAGKGTVKKMAAINMHSWVAVDIFWSMRRKSRGTEKNRKRDEIKD
jgi:hypothetical protein